MQGPDATTHDATTGILARLRAETRVEHEAIERELDLVSDALGLEAYRRRLVQLHGFLRPIEARLRPVPGLDLATRRKTPLLAADLVVLGVADPSRLAVCRELPRLRTPAARFGCLYVLEGATLGGQVISRHVRCTLGVTWAVGGRYFHAYGPRTGEMWQAFRAALAAFAATATTVDARDEIVATAVATFRALRRWCEAPLPVGGPARSLAAAHPEAEAEAEGGRA